MARIPTTFDQPRSVGKSDAIAHQHFSQGLAAHKAGHISKAAKSYERALQVSPRHFPALQMLGIIHTQAQQYERALQFFDAAIADYDKAIRLNVGLAEAHSNRGIALRELRRFDEAIASYEKAMMLRPGVAEVRLNHAIALEALKRFDEALISYEQAFALKPDLELLLGNLLHTKMRVCDWAGLDKKLALYRHAVRSSKLVTEPFPALSLIDEPALHKKAAELYIEAKFPRRSTRGAIRAGREQGRIRLGYFSADLHSHATGHLTAELFETHDRTKFEIIAFFFGPNTRDHLQNRLISAFDQFHDVGLKADKEIAALARTLEIDIAIDLMGHTKDSRMGVFEQRCAPIQVGYLGYAGTTGAPFIDYIVADNVILPKERRTDYTEKVVHLPNSYQPNDSKRPIADRRFTRQELGLPETGFVFCCFNGSAKIHPATFGIWMRLLQKIEGSVLWLYKDNSAAENNLRREAELRGVAGERLVFAGHLSSEEHLARHRAADLFLDTLPYNAHTTASDALWAGLPVLTLVGTAFAGRVAASLLQAIGLPELIVRTETEYEAMAFDLATKPDTLLALRDKLARNRLTTPLYDARLYTANLEAAFQAMYDRARAGLPPEHIDVV